MKLLLACAGLLMAAGAAAGQDKARTFDPTHTFSGFAEYSNDSSHILIGQSYNRKLVALGVSYARRLKSNSIASWRWQVDVRPLVLLRNPLLTTDETVTLLPGITPIAIAGLLPGTYHFASQQTHACHSNSGTGYFEGITQSGGMLVPVEAYSYASVCTNPWTYGGAISPLGQIVNFRPHSRLQPYVAANAGFLAFSKVVPSNNATMFNFTFEVAAGVQYYLRPGQAIALDYRYHHISNAYTGVENPGVDSGIFRVAYSFGR